MSLAERTVKLCYGHTMPLVMFGACQLRKISSLKAALEAGYRGIDTAQEYQNYRETGEAVRQHPAFVTSKISHRVKPGDAVDWASVVDEHLEEIGLKPLPLLLIHSPIIGTPAELKDLWQYMERCVDEGKVTSIGASN